MHNPFLDETIKNIQIIYVFLAINGSFVIHIMNGIHGSYRYTITVSQRQRYGNFVRRIALPHEQVLELIGIDTGSLQVSVQ